ncbi:SAVED domain-containing protein [Clostridium chromiireducens]|uniref:SAVED domain-containing protein n=1 Tax=Clostridium chromiireducens TaxID=225345 RepID=A0A964RMS5_9CLOT|nr:SAVED domain-containing protein [Clostridium chromiireducens]
MRLKEIAKDLKTKFIEKIKTCKLITFFIISIGVFIATVIGSIPVSIYENLKSTFFKNILLTMVDVCDIFTKIHYLFRITILAIIFISWVIIFYYRIIDKEKIDEKEIIHILGHTTFKNSQFDFQDKNISDKYSLDISRQFNVISEMNELKTEDEKFKYVLSNIINRQDTFINDFFSVNTGKYGYMGISHIPLILRAGNKIGDGIPVKLFHKKRDDDFYSELNNDIDYPQLTIEKKEIKPNAKELIVAIATTMKIEDYQLDILNPKNKSILKFNSEIFDVDVIVSERQLNQYVRTVLNEVRDCIRKNNIEKVHLVIASSVTFTFELGKRLNPTYDREVIIYHYEYKLPNPKFYTWGLSLFKKPDECIIVN